MRYAYIHAPVDRVAPYLPANYRPIATTEHGTIIGGEDDAGWTLEGYVLPRLASGLIVGALITTIADYRAVESELVR